MITVKPNGGLGNRMRVINSCLLLAQQKNQEYVKLFWSANSVLNAGFTDLFEPIDSIKQVSFPFPLLYCLLKEKMGNSIESEKKTITGHFYFNDDAIKKYQFNNAYWESKEAGLLFNTCYDFYKGVTTHNFYHLFKPQKNIQSRINQMLAGYKNHTAGIHIRRTDHVPSIKNSSTHYFINRMETMLQENTIHQFYLSTDDREVEAALMDHFGEKILTLKNKVLNRNSRAGMEDAVLDIYCLANTNIIIGSFQSTFSEVAAAINNIPLIIAK